MNDPMYQKQLIMKILEQIRIEHTDLLDAHQWNHLQSSRQRQLLKKYGIL